MAQNVRYGDGAPTVYDEPDLVGQSILARYAGLTRKRDTGELSVREALPYAYKAQDGEIWQKANDQRNLPRRVLTPEEVAKIRYDTVIVLRLQVLDPVEHAGTIVPCSCTLKGISVWQDEAGEWNFYVKTVVDPKLSNDRLSGFVDVSLALGLDGALLDATSPLFSQEDPETGEKAGFAYVKDALEKLEAPLTTLQILEHLIDPKLQEAAEAGRVVQCTIDPKSKKGNWVKRATVKAVSAAQAATAIEAAGDLSLPGKVEPVDVEKLNADIRAEIQDGRISKEDFVKIVTKYGVTPKRDAGPVLQQVMERGGASVLKLIHQEVCPENGIPI